MCGFLVYLQTGNNYYIQKRGQDFTNQVKTGGFTFVHNLLSITGQFTPQPFMEDGIVCVYNGEIYNHKFKVSDGENLIPLYKEYGPLFPKQLDGEWAIALYDFNKKIAVFATDLFATKPIWRNGLECASYQSGVGGHKITANTIEVVDFNGSTEVHKIHDWDLNQHKNTYDDWIVAFEKAVAKRATPRCFIGLSSGYDSGAIACELVKQRVLFKAYLIEGKENKETLTERMERVKNSEYISNSSEYKEEGQWIKNNVEPFDYKTHIGDRNLHQDTASLALSKICRLAHSEKRKVYLSGQGADEIISDYSLDPPLSSIKGVFPEKLVLWNNFYNGFQYAYLGKEEYVAGSHSIETRYPFLDKDVVQEFLWLTPECKNRHYKAPIREYLVRNKFPFLEDKKIGLSIKI